ncbi:hypothetical protein Gmet_3623 [Geobacter metallireducens GS-15]|uniref:Uncharacterized protein n=1 Tax=Geobacter metallireducens (strain ATCC 53774 / DSM 7210 / GS-15) TaxID=269799 RepID=J9JEP0_GEOMG|nr:hypothetical protein Gmet_3623 [Geobacter metallireducens GS-15]
MLVVLFYFVTTLCWHYEPAVTRSISEMLTHSREDGSKSQERRTVTTPIGSTNQFVKGE